MISRLEDSSENYDKSQIDPLLFRSPSHTFFRHFISAFRWFSLINPPRVWQMPARTEICLNIENATCFPFKIETSISSVLVGATNNGNIIKCYGRNYVHRLCCFMSFFHAFSSRPHLTATFCYENGRKTAKKVLRRFFTIKFH